MVKAIDTQKASWTSGATPSVAGYFGLFFQMWSEEVFGNTVPISGGTPFQNRPHMTTAKAAMINTASPWDFSGTTDFADVGIWNIEHFNDSVSDERVEAVADAVSRLSLDVLGLVEVRQVFRIPKVGAVAGCYVQEGTVRRGAAVRVLRDSVVIHDGELDSLKRFKEDVREVKSGFECGLSIKNFSDIKEGDQLEVYEVVEVARTL